MGYIDKIKLPDNKTYDIKHTIIPVVGTQTAATGSWTGNIDIDSLYDGLTIAYFLPYAGSGNATLNLTLKDGTTTGAINCYYNSSRLTTHYGKGSNIIMTYWSAGSIKIDGTATTDNRWIAQGNYADGNNKTQQTINNNDKLYPLLFSYAETSNATTNVTNIVYRNNDYFIDPSIGYIYSKKGFCAGPFTTATAGKRVWISQDGIYANNFLANYSVSAYERMIVRAWPGKHTSANGLLLTVDSGGLTMIGGGESSTNLAGLIDNDQTTDSPKRLDINNSQGATGKETTAFTADSEQLILTSDNNIYFITNCQTLANRHGFSLDSSGTFKPMTNNFGSIGSSDYKWQYGYFNFLNSNEVCTTKYRVSQYPNAVAMQVLAAGESAVFQNEALHVGVVGLSTILRGSVFLVDGDLFLNVKPTGVSEQGEVIYGDESAAICFGGNKFLYYNSLELMMHMGIEYTPLVVQAGGINCHSDLHFARQDSTSSDTTTYGITLDGDMALRVGENDTVDFGIITKDMVLYSTAISADCDVTFSQTLYLSNTTDVAAATYNHPALVIGERDPSDHTMSQHMEFDSNEIMAKTNDSTAGILYLQDESGSIQMGCGHIIIGKGTVTNTNIVICGKTYKSNTFADTNPKIIFKSADQSQNVSLTFTDFNDVGGNASITLNGNQGGEYFIAPYIKATSGIINPSDRRLKQNIQSLDSRYLDLIKNLNPVSFNFKEEKQNTKTHMGFIAQDVEKVIEKVGLTNEDIAAIIKPQTEEGYYELSYIEFIPALLLYIKDLEKQIKEIKEKEKY